jgi:peptidoglycan/LPS O-acetylase OafA/YrhL
VAESSGPIRPPVRWANAALMVVALLAAAVVAVYFVSAIDAFRSEGEYDRLGAFIVGAAIGVGGAVGLVVAARRVEMHSTLGALFAIGTALVGVLCIALALAIIVTGIEYDSFDDGAVGAPVR